MEETKSNRLLWIGAAVVVIIIVVLLLVLKPFGAPASDGSQAAEAAEQMTAVDEPDDEAADEAAQEPEPTPTAQPTEEAADTESEEEAEQPAVTPSPYAVISTTNITDVGEALVLSGHSADITEIAFSPDGTLLASASVDNTVKLWNAADGSLRDSLEGHEDKVLSLAFSPDGELLLSGSLDGTVRKWNVSDGELIDTISRSHPVRALDLAFSPDGSLFAVANHTGFVELRRTDTGILYKTIVQTDSFGFKEDFVLSWGLSFTPDGENIIVGAGRNAAGSSLRVYDVDTYAESELLIAMNVRIRDIQYAPDGETMVVAFLPLSVFWIVDAEDGSVQQVFEGHSYMVNSVGFSPDGSLIASSGEDLHVYLWNTATGEILYDLVGHEEPVNSVVFSPDGTVIATGSDDDTIRLWRVSGN